MGTVMKRHVLAAVVLAFAIPFNSVITAPVVAAPVASPVRIHNGLVSAPAGIAFVVEDQAAFVLDVGRAPGTANQFLGPQWTQLGCRPGMAAPNDSIHKLILQSSEANIQWDWGRVGDAAVGRLRADKPTTVTLKLLKDSWPGCASTYAITAEGATGEAALKDGKKTTWRLATSPAPASHDADSLQLALAPNRRPISLQDWGPCRTSRM